MERLGDMWAAPRAFVNPTGSLLLSVSSKF